MTRITCVTTRYLPNFRHLSRICEVDKVILLDLAPLPDRNRNSFVNRNRIFNKKLGVEKWLSVPILRGRGQNIRSVRIDPTDYRWIDKHTNTISHFYPDNRELAPGVLEKIRTLLKENTGNLVDINLSLLSMIIDILELRVETPEKQSKLSTKHTTTHRLDIARALNADEYLAGQVEWKVMESNGEIDRFNDCGIMVLKSKNLNLEKYDVNLTTRYSSVHTICQCGLDVSRDIVKNMINDLKI